MPFLSDKVKAVAELPNQMKAILAVSVITALIAVFALGFALGAKNAH